VVIEYNEHTRHSLQSLLNDVPILEGMTEGDRALLADAAVVRWYTDGEYIVRQGEVGDKFCILVEGQAFVTQVRNTLAGLVLASPAVFAPVASERSNCPSPRSPPAQRRTNGSHSTLRARTSGRSPCCATSCARRA
jgi:hypothetical protein